MSHRAPVDDAAAAVRRLSQRRRLYAQRALWVLLWLGAYRLGHRRVEVVVLGRESRPDLVGTRHPDSEIAEVIRHQPCRRRIDELVLHHTFDPSAAHFRGEPSVEAILRYHVVDKGWHNLAYHYLIAPDGTTWLGRPLDAIGTHTVGHNDHSVGVCLILNGDVEDPSPAQTQACATILRTLCQRFHLKPERNFAEGRGFHRDYANKTCPGNRITKRLVLEWLNRK